MTLPNNYTSKLRALGKLYKKFPNMAAIVVVNFSKERFVQKNWIDRSRVPWKPRKRKDKGSLMAKSGRLKRSIRKLSYTRNSVTIGTDVPYAQIHNDGGTINKTVNVKSYTRNVTKSLRSERTGRKLKKRVLSGSTKVRAHTRKINTTYPARQFLGDSALLRRRIERLIQKEIDKILNN